MGSGGSVAGIKGKHESSKEARPAGRQAGRQAREALQARARAWSAEKAGDWPHAEGTRERIKPERRAGRRT